MSDLSSLIYIGALAGPRHHEHVAEPLVRRPDLPRRADAVGRSAPLIAALTPILILLLVYTAASNAAGIHAPRPGLVYGKTQCDRATGISRVGHTCEPWSAWKRSQPIG